MNKATFSAQGASFREASFRGAHLQLAKLRGAIFEGAVLRDVNFRDADLRGAIFFDADLRGADLTGALIDLTDFRGADIRGAQMLPVSTAGACLVRTRTAGAISNRALAEQVLMGVVIGAAAVSLFVFMTLGCASA